MISLRNRHAAEKEKFRQLHGIQKFQYIYDYYKLPIAACCIILYIIAYSVYGKITHKDIALYAAMVNISAGEALTEDLGVRFLDYEGLNTAKNKVYLYPGLYLADDEDSSYHEYTYASRMKILAAIDAGQMDIVLMDREAFDAFSQNGYLCNIEEMLCAEAPELYQEIRQYLCINTSILEDNATDLYFDDSLSYQAKTEEYAMGLDLSASPVFARAGFPEPVYLGIVSNSPRKGTAIDYLRYLYASST